MLKLSRAQRKDELVFIIETRGLYYFDGRQVCKQFYVRQFLLAMICSEV